MSGRQRYRLEHQYGAKNQKDVFNLLFRLWLSLTTPTVSLTRTPGSHQCEAPLLARAPQTAFRSQEKRPFSKWRSLRFVLSSPYLSFWWQDSETLSEVETFPNYDSSDGEIVASRDPSRNHSLTSSGCHRSSSFSLPGISSNRASLTPTKTNIGTTLKQLLTSSRSNSRDKPKIMITRCIHRCPAERRTHVSGFQPSTSLTWTLSTATTSSSS